MSGRDHGVRPPATLSGLRVLVVSDAAPSRNGVGAYYQDLLEQLQGQVEAIHLECPRIVDDKWQAGLVLPLPGDKTQKLCLPNLWKLSRLMTELRPHVLVAATPGVYGIGGAYLARRRGIPIIMGFHTSFEQLTELYWPDSLQGKIVEKYFLYSNGYLLRRAFSVLGNAEPILEQARSLGAKRLRLVGTPISSQFMRQSLQAYQGGCEKVLFAGRLAKEKNIDALLAAVEALPQISFSIAGDGPLREDVESAARQFSNLNYLGWLDRDSLCQAVDDHDVLVLPSHFETFGTIALEAMARQRLVVVSRGCGISEWEELTPGLFVMAAGGRLQDSLKIILGLSREERLALAAKAYQCALAQNSRVVSQWGKILLEPLKPG